MSSKLSSLDSLLARHVTAGGPAECWSYKGGQAGGYRAGRRYGVLKHGGRKGAMWYAHRAAWVVANGPIPDGLYVCHRCDNTLCCNPAHLFLGTHRENMADMRDKGRSAYGVRSPRTRLSEEAVMGIRIAYARGGVTQQALADAHGVAHQHISAIVNGHRRRRAA